MNGKPGERLRRPLKYEGDTLTSGTESKRPVGQEQLMEHRLERENLMTALTRVELPRLFTKPTESAEPPWTVIRLPGGVGGAESRDSPLSR